MSKNDWTRAERNARHAARQRANYRRQRAMHECTDCGKPDTMTALCPDCVWKRKCYSIGVEAV